MIGQLHHGPAHQVGFDSGTVGIGNKQKVQIQGQFSTDITLIQTARREVPASAVVVNGDAVEVDSEQVAGEPVGNVGTAENLDDCVGRTTTQVIRKTAFEEFLKRRLNSLNTFVRRHAYSFAILFHGLQRHFPALRSCHNTTAARSKHAQKDGVKVTSDYGNIVLKV